MQYRKESLTNNECYHVFSRSIAKFLIFNSVNDFTRMIELLDLFRFTDFQHQYFKFKELTPQHQKNIIDRLRASSPRLVEIISYCLMPTHIHLVLRQISDNGISKFMARTLNSYSRYFNIQHQRTGPLWEGRFKSVHIKKDEQLLHVTRYAHLNAVSAGLVQKPEDWVFSSYGEYIGIDDRELCDLNVLPDFSPAQYKKFTDDQKDYQRSLQTIKNLLIDG